MKPSTDAPPLLGKKRAQPARLQGGRQKGGFWVLGFRAKGLGFRVFGFLSFLFRVLGFGFRVEFRVFGCRV